VFFNSVFFLDQLKRNVFAALVYEDFFKLVHIRFLLYSSFSKKTSLHQNNHL